MARPKGITAWNKGIPMSEESKKRISKSKYGSIPWNKGKVCPQLSESQKGDRNSMHGRPSPWKGRHPSDESRAKMRLARLGKPPSNKGQKRLQLPWNKGLTGIRCGKGKRLSESHKIKIGTAVRGTKNGMYGMSEFMRLQRLKQVFPPKDTKPERMMQLALTLSGVQFEKHKPFKLRDGSYHQVDLFVQPNLCIEVDGNYWHTRPNVMKRDIQINHDLNAEGYHVIRIWEKDIYHSTEKCIANILRLMPKMETI